MEAAAAGVAGSSGGARARGSPPGRFGGRAVRMTAASPNAQPITAPEGRNDQTTGRLHSAGCQVHQPVPLGVDGPRGRSFLRPPSKRQASLLHRARLPGSPTAVPRVPDRRSVRMGDRVSGAVRRGATPAARRVEHHRPRFVVQRQARPPTTAIYTGVGDDYRNKLLVRALEAQQAGIWDAAPQAR